MDEKLVAEYPDLERVHFWWSVRRFLLARIHRSIQNPRPERILDVGCGSGLTGAMLAESGASVVGIDVSSELVRSDEADGRVEFVVGDYLEMSKEVGQFDLVVAMDSVEHFADENAVMSALAENTSAGGYLVVTVPAYDWLWSSHDRDNFHFRRYTRQKLRAALENAGFRVERIGYVFLALTLPKAALTGLERVTERSRETGTNVSSWSNRVAARYFESEMRFAESRRNFLPFGTSVVAVARRSTVDS